MPTMFRNGPSRAMVVFEYPDGRVEARVLENLIDWTIDVRAQMATLWSRPFLGAFPEWVETEIRVTGLGFPIEYERRPDWFPPPAVEAPTKAIES